MLSETKRTAMQVLAVLFIIFFVMIIGSMSMRLGMFGFMATVSIGLGSFFIGANLDTIFGEDKK